MGARALLVPCSKPNHVSTRRDLRTRRRAVRVQRPTRHRRVHRALRIQARLWRRLPSARPGYRPYTDPYCSTDATDALREFCSKRWCCYVDAENCDLDDVHSSLLQSDVQPSCRDRCHTRTKRAARPTSGTSVGRRELQSSWVRPRLGKTLRPSTQPLIRAAAATAAPSLPPCRARRRARPAPRPAPDSSDEDVPYRQRWQARWVAPWSASTHRLLYR